MNSAKPASQGRFPLSQVWLAGSMPRFGFGR
jgi:hypothetical protein